MNSFKRLLLLGATLLMWLPLASGFSNAACVMCNWQGGCDFVEQDAFVNCRAGYGCSGNCRNRPPCPEEPCLLAEESAGVDGQKSTPICAAVEGATLKSMQTASQIYGLSGNDDLSAMSVLKLESNIRDGYLSDVGAFAFALPRNNEERSKVLAGNALAFTPFGVDVTGFADYSVGLISDDVLDVTVRAWRVLVATGEPLDGLTTKLKYRLNGNVMTLMSHQVVRDMPLPPPAVFKKKVTSDASVGTPTRTAQSFAQQR